MTAMARPRTGREAQPESVEDDPLVELARIVSGRSTFDEPRRRSVFEDESGISEADLARDLEAELLSDLQATFAAAGEPDEEPPFYAEEEMAGEEEPVEYAAEEDGDEPYDEAVYQAYDDGAEAFADELNDPEPDPEPAPAAPPPAPSGFRSAFSGFSLRSNRGGPAFNPNALSTEAAAAPVPAPVPRSGWAATTDEPVEDLEPLAPLSGFDDQEDWGLDAEPESIDPVYQESLAAAEAFVDETAHVPPPAPQPRHRDHRLDADPYGETHYRSRRRGRRYYSVFGILLVVAIGTAAVLVLRGGAGTTGEPPLITADDSPTRIFPDETTTTDPANVVFDRVDPDGAAAPNETLLDGAEPVTNVGNAAPADDGIAAILAPEADDTGNAADLPRMVRTVTVLPDGTIVNNNTTPANGAAPAADTPAEPAIETAANTPAPTAETPVAATPVVETPAAETAPAQTPAAETPATPAAETPAATTTTTAPAQVANTPTTATAIAAGIYVQVSAQGTEAAAQSTLQDLVTRAPSVLTGQPTAIDRAELPQGTYYRVLFGPYSAADADALRQRLAAVGIDSFIQRY